MQFGLAHDFGVDGKLGASSREEAFTLGVEWGSAWEAAKVPGAWSKQVHAENADRIAAMLAQQGRRFTVAVSGGWATIAVVGLD